MFNHVLDDRLRAILETPDTPEADLLYALDVTEDTVFADMEDEDVPGKAVEHRLNTYWEAFNAWEEDHDAERCMAALRDCWGD